MQQPIDKELLKKYLKDTCTPSELQRVRAYLLRADTEEILHELIAAESEAEWNDATKTSFVKDDQMREWQSKFELRKAVFPETTTTEIKTTPGFFKRNNFLKYAAVLTTVMLGIGIYSLSRLKENQATSAATTAKLIMKEFSTVKGQRAKITLADGTMVYMGPASTLKYPEQFKDSIRGISLEGEAFFEVAHNPHKPFIIETHNIHTQVLGTSFKVNAIEGRPFEVQVATGKVRVDRINPGHTEHLAVLTPGQQVVLSNLTSEAVIGQVAIQEVRDWKQSILVFKDQTLSEIARQLERAYDVQFSFKNAAKAREVVTVTLQDNVPLNQTLRILSAGAQFKYSIKGKNITIN
ncbi:FecR family protein [Pedobacter nyackensis]|uniref:FecR family protein n=1 Tax=Pedobacter nyackensis TaxID=475255 RepID=A0A1W2CXU2_9SPHI|nr:FecR domain-containing protein [Pedobacter nyackensis]SMC89980.1 FecR family protein [Pedobacter nyackensis]